MGDCRTEDLFPPSVPVRKPRVLATGFGPFGEHAVNASWESVRRLRELQELTDFVELFVEEIPVKYAEVSAIVPDLWTKYNPDLVIHCGVSGLLAWKNTIQIETRASCHGPLFLAVYSRYHRPDVDSRIPALGLCAADDGEKCIMTNVNLDGLHTWLGPLEQQNSPEERKLQCQSSDDAGRFLCEFIYYTSLRINDKATIFIHVPPLYKPFGAGDIAQAISRVILKVIEQNNLPCPGRRIKEKGLNIPAVQHMVLGLEEFPALTLT